MSDYHTIPDRVLLDLLKEGDQAAFTEIYQRYWELLFGLTYNRIKDFQAAEDIVQEVFASLWQNRQQAAITSLKAYLATASKYVAWNWLRKKKTVSQEAMETVSVPSMGEDRLQYQYLLEIMKAATDQLPEKCRVIFLYSREEGLNAKEIAERLKISPGTVEVQLSKALRHLRKALKGKMTLLFSWFTMIFLKS